MQESEATHARQQRKGSLTARQLSSPLCGTADMQGGVSEHAGCSSITHANLHMHARMHTHTHPLLSSHIVQGTACPPVIDSASAAISSWAQVRILSSGRSCCSSVLASMASEALTPDIAAVLARLLGGRGDAPSRAVLYTKTARSAPNGARPCSQPQQCVLMPLTHGQALLQVGVAARLHCFPLQYLAFVMNVGRGKQTLAMHAFSSTRQKIYLMEVSMYQARCTLLATMSGNSCSSCVSVPLGETELSPQLGCPAGKKPPHLQHAKRPHLQRPYASSWPPAEVVMSVLPV